MTKLCRRIVLFSTALVLSAVLALPCRAGALDYYLTPEDTGGAETAVSDDLIGDLIRNLPDEVRENMPESVTEDMTTGDAISALSFKKIAKQILGSLAKLLPVQQCARWRHPSAVRRRRVLPIRRLVYQSLSRLPESEAV